MFRRSPLQHKLIFAFVLVLLIPTGIIAFYSINTASSTIIGKISSEELRAVVTEADTIQNRLVDTENDVVFLAQTSPTRRYVAALENHVSDQTALDAETSLFLSFLRRSPQYHDLSIVTLAGREVVRVVNIDGTPQVVKPEAANQSGFAYFNQAVGSLAGQVYISDYTLNSTDGKIDQPYVPIIRYSTPLYTDSGTIVGVLALKALLQPLIEDKFSTDPSSETYIVDKDGSYLLHPNPNKRFGRLLKTGITLDNDQPNDVAQMFGGRQGTILASKDKPDSLQVFAQIKPAGQIAVQWLLVRQKAISTMLSEVNGAQVVIVGLAGLALLVAIAVALFLTNNIVRPVRQLVRVADAISRGEWDTAIPTVSTGDEINHLASAFERMLRELRALYDDLENRVAARTAEAERASQAKSLFLSNMSHELRTPLNVIIGYSTSMLNVPEMFNNVPIPEVYRPYLQLVETNGQYLLGLINDILDLSKIESGKFELQIACVDLKDIFPGVISTSVGLLRDKPVQIQPDYPDNLPKVQADPLRVRQIILNLMSNAIKFTQNGRITLSAREEDRFVRISIIDTGIGIPENALATIFDRFKQAEADTTRDYGGTGLGLDISKQLCLMHGSDLTVHSVFGKGSTFSFTLPVATSEQIAVETAPPRPIGAVTLFDDVSIPNTPVILLAAEDNETRHALHETLEGAGYVVVNTNDGANALELASGMLPALVILDEQLPTLDGWKVLQALKESGTTSAIPVVVCVDAGQQPHNSAAIAELPKPIVREQVLETIGQVLKPALEGNG